MGMPLLPPSPRMPREDETDYALRLLLEGIARREAYLRPRTQRPPPPPPPPVSSMPPVRFQAEGIRALMRPAPLPIPSGGRVIRDDLPSIDPTVLKTCGLFVFAAGLFAVAWALGLPPA